MLNDVLQVGSVIVLLIYCVYWIVKRIRRGFSGGCDEWPQDGCDRCKLAEHCRKTKNH